MRASQSHQRAEDRHAEVNSPEGISYFGPLDLSAQDESASALRTATPEQVGAADSCILSTDPRIALHHLR
jgi:hypothetical protein